MNDFRLTNIDVNSNGVYEISKQQMPLKHRIRGNVNKQEPLSIITPQQQYPNKNGRIGTKINIRADWENIRWWEDEDGNETDWYPQMICPGTEFGASYQELLITDKRNRRNVSIMKTGLASKIWN